MASTVSIPFRKMNGLGNDFVVLDARPRAIAADRSAGPRHCRSRHRHRLRSGDRARKLARADVRMRIWNSEGAEVESCGNASRCIADLLFRETGRSLVTIDTRGGFLVCKQGGRRAGHRRHGRAAIALERNSAARGIQRHPPHRAPGRSHRQADPAYAIRRERRQSPLHLLGRRRRGFRSRQDRSAARASSAVSRGREHLARPGRRARPHRSSRCGSAAPA